MEEEVLGTQSATLRDYLRVVFRQKTTVLTCVITVMATVLIGLIFKTPVYEAQVKMLITAEKQVEATYYREIFTSDRSTQLVLTQSEIVKSNPVLGLTVRALALYLRPLDYEKLNASIFKKPFIIVNSWITKFRLRRLNEEQRNELLYRLALANLRDQVKVEPLRDTNMFTISLRDYNPLIAAVLANAVSRAYVIFDLQQQLAELQLKYGEKHPTALQLKDNIEKIAKSLNGQPLPDAEAIGPASVKIVEQATIPPRPVGPPKIVILILAFIMSIFLGVMLAFTFEYLDQTYKSPDDAERSLGIPYLGSIAKNATMAEYHDLADGLYLVMRDQLIKTLLVASSTDNEGVTTIIANLGSYLAKTAGRKVLIIDANLRKPGMYEFFKLTTSQGLIDVLEGKTSLDKAIKDLGGDLHVLVSGESVFNPFLLLNSHAMAEVLRLARERYDIVLIDCAPIGEFRDAVVISRHIDAITVVVNEGKTRRQVVKAAIEPLIEKKANLIGVILNNRTFPIPEKIYNRV